MAPQYNPQYKHDRVELAKRLSVAIQSSPGYEQRRDSFVEEARREVAPLLKSVRDAERISAKDLSVKIIPCDI